MTTFPTLYKKTSTGKIQRWDISVLDPGKGPSAGVIKTEFGQVGGKTQMTVDYITEGKNAGRTNATTPLEQALAEAKAKWEKQKKKGYVESLDDAQAGKRDALITGGIDPMLAHPYSKHGHKIVYPAFAQPKLDGIRCIAMVSDGVCTLWSRTRKPITGVPHIQRELERLFPSGSHTFDGELYNHDLKAEFEKIVSYVRQETPAPGHDVVEYHIYDVVSEMRFDLRADLLSIKLGTRPSAFCIRKVPTGLVQSEEHLMERFSEYLADGYEGAMVRNAAGLYENKRSYGLQKVKEYDDSEFEIVGVSEGRGKLAGHAATFVCKTATGQTFEAKMKGSTEMLRRYWEDHSLWRGKQLTVKYQGFTNTNGVPRFPVGVALRDYE